MFFLIGLSGISNYLNLFSLSYDTAKSLIDSRAQNIAAVISITLVVVGFIIGNLAEKSTLVLALIFKRSYLYPIIYYVLTTLGFIFAISTLRDFLGFDKKEFFVQMVVTATYLSIFTLLLIGFLFQSITTYTNAEVISSMVHDAFMKEVKQTHIGLLLMTHSKRIFREEMERLNVAKFDIYRQLNLMNLNAGESEVVMVDQVSNSPRQYLVRDLNMKKIGTYVNEKQLNPEQVYFKDTAIYSIFTLPADYITQDNVINTAKDNKVLLKALKTKNVRDSDQSQGIVRTHLNKKFEQHVKSGDLEQLRIVLNSFREAYQFKMQYQ